MDKDTGRPRGFGFVTFEGEAAVEATLAQPLTIHGKAIEVKRAQPRGNIGGEDEGPPGKFGRGRGRHDRFNRNQDMQNGGMNQMQQQPESQQNANNLSPAMMAQYWSKMQQWFQMMSAMQGQNQQMNPAMMQQMMAMQNGGAGANQAGGMGNMNPAMMQQMQQAQQMQMMNQMKTGGGPNQRMMSPMQGGIGNRPGSSQQSQGETPSSWEGMYDDVPQPNQGQGGGPSHRGRGGHRNVHTPQPAGQAPLNAPTGPKNPGRGGPSFRGGRGRHHNFHPYSRG